MLISSTYFFKVERTSKAFNGWPSAFPRSSYTLTTTPALSIIYVTRPGNAPNKARGTFHDVLNLSPLSINKSNELSLFVLINFSLSAALPDDTPKTFALNFLKSGAFFSNVHASFVQPGVESAG